MIAEQPETTFRTGVFHAMGFARHALDVEPSFAFDDHHTADRWAATKAEKAPRARWSNDEPVPLTEGRLHRSSSDRCAPDAARLVHNGAWCELRLAGRERCCKRFGRSNEFGRSSRVDVLLVLRRKLQQLPHLVVQVGDFR